MVAFDSVLPNFEELEIAVSFKEQLKKDEEREIKRIEDETKQKLQEFERDLSQKFDGEKSTLL